MLSWALQPREPTSLRFDGLRLPNPAKVGVRLMSFAQEWDALTTDLYVRSIVKDFTSLHHYIVSSATHFENSLQNLDFNLKFAYFAIVPCKEGQ